MSDDPSVYLRPSSSREVFDQTRIFDTKKWLWVPDEEEGFKKACVKSVRGDKVLVELTGGQVYNNNNNYYYYCTFASNCRMLSMT